MGLRNLGSGGRWEMRLAGEVEEEMVRSGLPTVIEPENPEEILLGRKERKRRG